MTLDPHLGSTTTRSRLSQTGSSTDTADLDTEAHTVLQQPSAFCSYKLIIACNNVTQDHPRYAMPLSKKPSYVVFPSAEQQGGKQLKCQQQRGDIPG